MITFPISGVETFWWFPSLAAMLIAAMTSTGGLSGAFILMPFQVSILHFTGPAASPTNLLFAVIAVPSGVWRYYRERRVVWPLAWLLICGTLPGALLGVYLRINFLPNPHTFKLFVGIVLAYVAVRLLQSLLSGKQKPMPKRGDQVEDYVSQVAILHRRVNYRFAGEEYSASAIGILLLGAIVGVISGTYGIGGSALIAPFLVSVWRLPVYTIAGASLAASFVTALGGVLDYWLLAPLMHRSPMSTSPDWMLGLALGLGGAIGIYIGARLQRYLPARLIKLGLLVSVLSIAGKYIYDFIVY